MSDEHLTAEQAQAARKALLDDYVLTFTSPHGARVLEDLRASAFVYRSTAVTDHNGRVDPAGVVFREGARGVVLAIETNLRKAKQGRPELQTHAVSSTAEQDT